jgi:hypothetical protein
MEQKEPVWVKLGLTWEQFNQYPVAWRMTVEREHNPKAPEKRRMTYTPVTLEQYTKAYADLTPEAAITKFRYEQQSKS